MRRQCPNDHTPTLHHQNLPGTEEGSLQLLPSHHHLPPTWSQICAASISARALNSPHGIPRNNMAVRIFHTNPFHTSFTLLNKEDKTSRFRVHSLLPLPLANRRHLGWGEEPGGGGGGEGGVRCGPSCVSQANKRLHFLGSCEHGGFPPESGLGLESSDPNIKKRNRPVNS